MIGLKYPYTIFKPVQSNYVTDTEIVEIFKQLKITQYASFEIVDNQLIVKFTFQGDQFISLSDLINFKINNCQCFQVDYAFVIIYSILAEFQTKYEKHQLNVSFNPEEIWINIGQQSDPYFEVIFTNIDFYKNKQVNLDIAQLKNTIENLLELFLGSDSKIIREVDESLQKCTQINEIQSIIQKKLKVPSQLKINLKIVDNFENLVDILKQPMEISLKRENYDVLINNIINWIAKSNEQFNTNVTIKDLFKQLQLEASYKILTQWDDLDDIFIILKENEILNSHLRLQSINYFIFLLSFPKQRLKLDNQITVSYSESTLKWVEQLEKFIGYKMNHYIKNILEFYKGDKEEWIRLDFKCIFNKIRQQYNDMENVEQTINNYQFLKEFTFNIIKAYYQEKVDGLNQEIIKIMFKKK